MVRFSVGTKLTGAELVQKIEHVICDLYGREFIVNQIASNGASGNVMALKLLATHTAKEVFLTLDPKLPQDIPVAFKHSFWEQ